MRDPRRKTATFTRTRRRAILIAAIMMAGSPAIRADDSRPTVRILPPLPLVATDGNGAADKSVQNNPFCKPKNSGQNFFPVQLASGDQMSAVRLKPIGTAVGLHPIGGNAPVKIESSALTIEETPAAQVQVNPLFGSQHHENPDLIEAEVISPHDQHPQGVPTTSSSQVLTMIPPVNQGPSDSAASNHSPVNGAVHSQPPMQPVPLMATEAAHQQAAPTQQAAPIQHADRVAEQPAAVQDEAEPIFFSMSDDSETSLAETEPATAAETAPVAKAPVVAAPVVAAPVVPTPAVETEVLAKSKPETSNDEVAVVEVAKPAAELDKEAVRRHPVAVTAPALELAQPLVATQREPVEIDPPVLAVPAADAEQLPNAIHGSEPIVSAPAIKSQMNTKAKRYRPPVAVVAPPLAIERMVSAGSASIVRPTVKPVEAPMLGNDVNEWDSIKIEAGGAANKPMPKVSLSGKGNELTPLYLSRAQVRSLTIGGQLRRVSVANKSVCQAFAAGPNQLKLIGTGNGVTRLVVWADASDDAPTRVRSFEIHVNDAVDANGAAVGDKTKMLNQSIRKAFPGSTVNVKQYEDRLTVTGHCDSEDSAKKIVRMVRKTCLIPVHDELQVR